MTPLSCFDIGRSSPPPPEMLKYVEPKFAFMSMFCLHILGVRKKRANFAACKPTQAYDWFPLVHLLQKGRSLLIHSDKSIELKHSLIWIWQPWWNIQKKVLSFTSSHVSFLLRLFNINFGELLLVTFVCTWLWIIITYSTFYLFLYSWFIFKWFTPDKTL